MLGCRGPSVSRRCHGGTMLTMAAAATEPSVRAGTVGSELTSACHFGLERGFVIVRIAGNYLLYYYYKAMCKQNVVIPIKRVQIPSCLC